MNDSSTEERLALIAEGSTLTLEQAVRELLDVADDAMRSISGVTRPDEAHGGAYLSRWRFARLRNALGSCPPPLPDTFVERAIHVARQHTKNAADATVMLSAFEASAIRRAVPR